MRILAIRGQNLASLARSFAIDLERGPLAGTGLFAITGPVGAGKSTLLDALCLPLFDRTPRLSGRGGVPVGDDGVAVDEWLRTNDPRTLLRRDAAAGHAEVDFVGRDGLRYRARWSVRRARHKIDGRVQEQELQLTELGRNVVVASGRRSEVLAAIEQRLGLDFGQFCRSVLLAQGEFAAFLRASADERAKLLETLTGADVYRRLSKAAHERARKSEREVDLLRAQTEAQAPLSAEARSALEAAARQWGEELAACRVGIALASRYVSWHDTAEQHRQRESVATTELQQAMRAFDAAAARRHLCERRQRALAVVPRLQLVTAAADAAAKAQAAAQAAAAATAASAADCQRARTAFAAKFTSVFAGPLPEPVPALVRDLAPWDPLLRQWQDAELALAQVAQQVPVHEREVAAAAAAAAEVRGEVQTAAAALTAAATAMERARAATASLPGTQLAQARTELDRGRQELARHEGLLARWQAAAEQAAAGAGLAQAAQEAVALADVARREAAGQRDQARSATQAARTTAETLRARIGLSALRAQLASGEPCPLCGAKEHPATHQHDDEGEWARAKAALAACEQKEASAQRAAARAEADHQAAQREGQRATEQAAAAASALAVARRSCLAACPDLSEGAEWSAAQAAWQQRARSLEQANAALLAEEARARAAAALLEETVQKATAANDRWRALGEREHLAAERLHKATAAGAALQATAAASRRRIEDAKGALAPSCAGLPDGIAAVERLASARLPTLRALNTRHSAWLAAMQAGADITAAASTARAEAERSQADAERAQAALAQAMATESVTLDDVASAAAIGAVALANEARALQELATEVTRRRAILQERAEQRRAHENREQPSLDAAEAQQALEHARASAHAVEQQLLAAQSQLGADDLIRRHRAELLPRLAAAEHAAVVWQKLDELIGSSSGDAFAVFAQELTLDLLLLEANRRLAELARRYRLHKNPGGALDFVVVDLDLGGTRRSLMTLSGGETFLVSLALALALATLAAPRSRVETLFLDEGFGTLDAQSLEVALGALDSLQASGCQVGVISHVDGIAERIGAQVVVQPEGGGRSRVSAQVR